MNMETTKWEIELVRTLKEMNGILERILKEIKLTRVTQG